VEQAALLKLEAELVNMSACETGLGKIVRGDGVVRLARALLAVGTNRAAVTLWTAVEDAATEFIEDFYSSSLALYWHTQYYLSCSI
jgi:CHAT domain-containing protein